MTTSTLRTWGGAIAVSLPKKVLGMLGLQAGAEVAVRVEDGNIILSPSRGSFTLARLEKEQRALERSGSGVIPDRAWHESPARGRELL